MRAACCISDDRPFPLCRPGGDDGSGSRCRRGDGARCRGRRRRNPPTTGGQRTQLERVGKRRDPGADGHRHVNCGRHRLGGHRPWRRQYCDRGRRRPQPGAGHRRWDYRQRRRRRRNTAIATGTGSTAQAGSVDGTRRRQQHRHRYGGGAAYAGSTRIVIGGNDNVGNTAIANGADRLGGSRLQRRREHRQPAPATGVNSSAEAGSGGDNSDDTVATANGDGAVRVVPRSGTCGSLTFGNILLHLWNHRSRTTEKEDAMVDVGAKAGASEPDDNSGANVGIPSTRPRRAPSVPTVPAALPPPVLLPTLTTPTGSTPTRPEGP